ncbi:hypothetical protein HK096_011054, partial [Nowakowskiella sp. JEL0078]
MASYHSPLSAVIQQNDNSDEDFRFIDAFVVSPSELRSPIFGELLYQTSLIMDECLTSKISQ